MTKRAQALVIIREEVAKAGAMTQTAMRAYLDNRVSRAAFDEACKAGMRIYHRRASEEARVRGDEATS